MPATVRALRPVLLPIAAVALAAAALVAPAAAAPSASAAGTVSQQTLTATYTQPRLTRVERALRIMRAQVGDPYAYGAAGPNAFDCSGLIYYGTHRAGFTRVPRTSRAQAGFMRRIAKRAVRPGDFVFFSSGGGVYHAGVYVGRNRILHSPRPGARVRVDPLWTSGWFAGTLRGRG